MTVTVFMYLPLESTFGIGVVWTLAIIIPCLRELQERAITWFPPGTMV